MIELSEEAALRKELNANKKVVTLFYASWCPFCRSFLSVFAKHAEQDKTGLFLRVKIDEDENPMWETYSIAAVPSVILFENGKLSRRLDCELGAGLTERQFSKWLGTNKAL
jgi:thioredoxin 1